MDDLWHQILSMVDLSGLGGRFNAWEIAKIIFQFLISGYAIFWTWGRIHGTQAERLVKGIMFFVSCWLVAYFMGLTIITAILREMIPVLLIAVVIVFQPELRRGLGYLGRTRFRVDFALSDTHNEKAKEVIAQIIQAVRELSRTKTGALIVVEPPEGERDYVSPGTTINADVSAGLLLSLFHTSSPLHDGAVVIRQNKIIAAGVILPMTDSTKLHHRYGTRHRAALGLSERYDGLCIVASEETGAISAANRGMLVRYNTADELADALNYMYHQVSEQKAESLSPLGSFLALFNRRKQGAIEPGAIPRRRATDIQLANEQARAMMAEDGSAEDAPDEIHPGESAEPA